MKVISEPLGDGLPISSMVPNRVRRDVCGIVMVALALSETGPRQRSSSPGVMVSGVSLAPSVLLPMLPLMMSVSPQICRPALMPPLYWGNPLIQFQGGAVAFGHRVNVGVGCAEQSGDP